MSGKMGKSWCKFVGWSLVCQRICIYIGLCHHTPSVRFVRLRRQSEAFERIRFNSMTFIFRFPDC